MLTCGVSAGSPRNHLRRWQHGRLAGHGLRHQRGCGQAGGRTDGGEQDGHQEHLREPRWQTPGVWGSQRDAEVGGGERPDLLELYPGKEPRGGSAWKLCVTRVPAGSTASTACRRSWRWRPTTPRSSVWSTASQRLVGVAVFWSWLPWWHTAGSVSRLLNDKIVSVGLLCNSTI